MIRIETTVFTNAVDQYIRVIAKATAKSFRIGIRVYLFTYVKPEHERFLKHFVVFMCATH